MNRTRIFDVRIDRGTTWGNPYRVGRDGTRAECIEKWRQRFYRRLEDDREFYNATLALRGLVLACWCVPDLECHGSVIVRWLDG